ncbi:hypothetical protein ACLQ24_30355, partial [Micromonospora sp. DT4]|uniref:hypothetical protein n=1 Tax=Micromonospora sp. DT4 TaxID=3393438 RepID=UPI003CEA6127
TPRTKQRAKPYSRQGDKSREQGDKSRKHFTPGERVDAINTWVAQDSTNRRNAVPASDDTVTVGENKYPIGRIFDGLVRVEYCKYDKNVAEALKKNGYTVERDGHGHMHIVKFQRMKDEKARDFLAIYED